MLQFHTSFAKTLPNRLEKLLILKKLPDKGKHCNKPQFLYFDCKTVTLIASEIWRDVPWHSVYYKIS